MFQPMFEEQYGDPIYEFEPLVEQPDDNPILLKSPAPVALFLLLLTRAQND